MRRLFVVVLVSAVVSGLLAIACGGGAGGGSSDKPPMTPDSEHTLVDPDASAPPATSAPSTPEK